MSKVIIIGAGGVGRVVAYKCAQHPEVFSEIMLASRTVSKCEKIAEDVRRDTGHKHFTTAQIDADDVPALVALFNDYKPKLVILGSLISLCFSFQIFLSSGYSLRCFSNLNSASKYIVLNLKILIEFPEKPILEWM